MVLGYNAIDISILFSTIMFHVIEESCCQEAWLQVVRHLADSPAWEQSNVCVSITNPSLTNYAIHDNYCELCCDLMLKTPKQVADTIFPHRFSIGRNADQLYRDYNKDNGLFDRIQILEKKVLGRKYWGTYFRRLTHYDPCPNSQELVPINQIELLINRLKNINVTYKAAYTLHIQYPGSETMKIMGGPCLNYIAVQLQRGAQSIINLLAVYRNHDFLKRAYGNYLGLSSLLHFVCKETNSIPGSLACISSHAYISDNRRVVIEWLKRFD